MVTDFEKENYRTKEPLELRALKATGRGLWIATKAGGKYLVAAPIKAAYREIKKRRFDVDPQDIVVVLDRNYRLFKNDLAYHEARGMISIGYDPLKLYQEKPDLFAKGAKILGPRGRKYFKWPGQVPIRVETFPITIDPEPTEETVNFEGIPVSFLVDTKINYTKHPIYFVLKNSGKLKRGDPNCIGDLENNLISEVENLVHGHFQLYNTFPDVFTHPIDPTRLKSKERNLLEKYGVNAGIMIHKFRPSPDQREIIMKMIDKHPEVVKSNPKLKLNEAA